MKQEVVDILYGFYQSNDIKWPHQQQFLPVATQGYLRKFLQGLENISIPVIPMASRAMEHTLPYLFMISAAC